MSELLRNAMIVAAGQAAKGDVPTARALIQRALDIERKGAGAIKAANHRHENAAAAFKEDMQPVVNALVEALREDDEAAYRGLRAMLPQLLGEANADSALADELIRIIGRKVAEGMDDGFLAGEQGPALHPRSAEDGRYIHKGTTREHWTKGVDQFGHLPNKHSHIEPKRNIARGFRVIAFLQQPGQRVEKAMFRADVGAVGMEYGSPDHDTGYGNSHIESKHGRAALMKVPEIIQYGELYPHDDDKKGNRRYLFHGEDILILKRVSSRRAWTVSSYEDPEKIKKVKGGTQ